MAKTESPSSPVKTELIPLPSDMEAFITEQKKLNRAQHPGESWFEGPDDAILYFGEPGTSADLVEDAAFGVPLLKIGADYQNRCGMYLRGDVYDIGGAK